MNLQIYCQQKPAHPDCADPFIDQGTFEPASKDCHVVPGFDTALGDTAGVQFHSTCGAHNKTRRPA